mgnify:CR=1 FL=1
MYINISKSAAENTILLILRMAFILKIRIPTWWIHHITNIWNRDMNSKPPGCRPTQRHHRPVNLLKFIFFRWFLKYQFDLSLVQHVIYGIFAVARIRNCWHRVKRCYLNDWNHCCPVKIHSVPDGTFNNFYYHLYQHLVPNGTVPEGLNIGRIKSNPLLTEVP